MQKKITVLLVDDHSLVRRGFRRMLEDEPDMEVVGEAGDGEESVQAGQATPTAGCRHGLRSAGYERLAGTRQIISKSPLKPLS